MELIAKLGEREVRVDVERHGSEYLVSVEGELYRVDAIAASPMGRSYLIDGTQHEVGIKALGNGHYEISSTRGLSRVEVVDPLTHMAKEASAARSTDSVLEVRAYMPGRVVEVLAGEGEEISAGEGVLVLEAMKMENEIQAERSGTVTRIFVEPGQTVENGDPLFEIR